MPAEGDRSLRPALFLRAALERQVLGRREDLNPGKEVSCEGQWLPPPQRVGPCVTDLPICLQQWPVVEAQHQPLFRHTGHKLAALCQFWGALV